ncbi:MAG: 4-alpha-glucanotransferase [Verrucomicrobia bacterium]|nr:4-alpha-glucanotransferase [Verrucomicrobiota bacterium]
MSFPRAAGILLHPTSLPGRYGIGEIGPEAHRWLAHLHGMSQRLWQVLPLGPTGYADSPYQTLSTFAGNPMLISFEALREEGLLLEADLKNFPSFPADRVDYGPVIAARTPVLEKAARSFARRASAQLKAGLAKFEEENHFWLEDYALFTTLKKHYGNGPWVQWPAPLVRREAQALQTARKEHATGIRQAKILQFLFFHQWDALRREARARGVSIIGDVPIFVAHDSADVWCRPDLFFLQPDGQPTVVAGVPPDYFSVTGQRWGNPLYRLEAHEKEGYAWWTSRLKAAFALYDIVRIDHFRGFAAYWEIPATEATAVKGRWVPGPGRKLFDAAKHALGAMPIIAEDLGVITPDVEQLRDGLGYPGMRILQFAFGDDPKAAEFRPDSYPKDCVVYTGTHDNDTTVGWYRSEPGKDSTRTAEQIERERHTIRTYLHCDGSQIHWDLIALALRSNANTALYPMQDILGMDSSARMNVPGREGGNWAWRFRWEQLTPDIEQRLGRLTRESNRA